MATQAKTHQHESRLIIHQHESSLIELNNIVENIELTLDYEISFNGSTYPENRDHWQTLRLNLLAVKRNLDALASKLEKQLGPA